jgi:4-hydroxy-tetrahydrodipicolinate reductase
MTSICVAGAAGRMASILIKEAVAKKFSIVGAVESLDNPNIGKTLKQIGICKSDVRLVDSSNIKDAAENADVYISFTTPSAEIKNLPIVADMGIRIVMGTTGFSEMEMQQLKKDLADKVTAVFSPNYSIGINILFNIGKVLSRIPSDYDFSITEVHHTGKKDAPSGTAKKLASIISEVKGYSTLVHGREGMSIRKTSELEVLSARIGGIPGIHNLLVGGTNELLRFEHIAFSRKVFANGALYAARWICEQKKPGIYSMDDVLGLNKIS